MFTAQEIAEIKRWHPDEIKNHAEDTLSFMWSPTGGLFIGDPMDEDPTRNVKMKFGAKFRPNHAEMMMMDPDFDQKFFKGRPDLLELIAKEPYRSRDLIDSYGLSGRIGNIKIGGMPRRIVGFWPSENFQQYAHKIIGDCSSEFKLKPNDIVYCWKKEPMTVEEAMTGQLKSDPCMSQYASFSLEGGRRVDVGDIIACLHHVRGTDLNKIRGPFCDQYQDVRKRCASSDNCRHLLGLLDDCWRRLGCNKTSYNTKLNRGSAIMQADLQPTFAQPDQHYRNQKELDSAWDTYQKLQTNRQEVSFHMFFNTIALLEGVGTCPCKKSKSATL